MGVWDEVAAEPLEEAELATPLGAFVCRGVLGLVVRTVVGAAVVGAAEGAEVLRAAVGIAVLVRGAVEGR